MAGAEPLGRLQKVAVEESRLGIPLLFAMDVVHGYRTIFPVPLALAATWAPESQERAARVAADEATAAGLHWTFAPMIDIARDPRWGRIVEGAGEDPYLGARMAVAQVRGYQGGNRLRPGSLMATAKHFGAYGAAIGGRDYNSADISERTLQEVYLPPFYAAARAGAGSFMAAFNDIAGVPTTANKELLRGLLRETLGLAGAHGQRLGRDRRTAQPRRGRGSRGGRARSHSTHRWTWTWSAACSPTTSRTPSRRIPRACKQLDEAVLRILRVKEQLGLFDKPMHYHDTEREARELLAPEHREAARAIARQSLVLLQERRQAAAAGCRQAAQHRRRSARSPADGLSALGSWRAQGKAEDVVTILQGIQAAAPQTVKVRYAPGADPRTPDPHRHRRRGRSWRRPPNVTVLVIGEDFDLSGEARSRSDLELPASQLELARRVLRHRQARGRGARQWPAARPVLARRERAGHSRDLDAGRRKAATRSPTCCSASTRPRAGCPLRSRASPARCRPTTRRTPRVVPPIPISRRTRCVTTTCRSRPSSPSATASRTASSGTATSRRARGRVGPGERIDISITVENIGGVASDEVVQLYVRDPVASDRAARARAARLQAHRAAAGARKRVTLQPRRPSSSRSGVRAGQWLIEAGRIDFWIGASSADLRVPGSFEITTTHTGTAPAAALPTRVTVSSDR